MSPRFASKTILGGDFQYFFKHRERFESCVCVSRKRVVAIWVEGLRFGGRGIGRGMGWVGKLGFGASQGFVVAGLFDSHTHTHRHTMRHASPHLLAGFIHWRDSGVLPKCFPCY